MARIEVLDVEFAHVLLGGRQATEEHDIPEGHSESLQSMTGGVTAQPWVTSVIIDGHLELAFEIRGSFQQSGLSMLDVLSRRDGSTMPLWMVALNLSHGSLGLTAVSEGHVDFTKWRQFTNGRSLQGGQFVMLARC